ncbi:unnamed protein product [Mytilus coruscus]|uniref:Uncharacterized protein n=1 Tax=Mytilus coruscus TaxID=42192 RepID=A0A6J8BCU6_MYTCO|nr:unnamed protein product [Mytilus coruscus]
MIKEENREVAASLTTVSGGVSLPILQIDRRIQTDKFNQLPSPTVPPRPFKRSRIDSDIETSTLIYPLFVKENGSALDRDFFIRSLRQVLDICGFNSSLYNGHSFRIGASTSAGSVNIQDHLIKLLVGGHQTVIVVIFVSQGHDSKSTEVFDIV